MRAFRPFRPVAIALALVGVAPNLLAQELPPALAARFSAGVDALRAGSAGEAERAFRDVLAAGGDRAFVRHNLGIVLQQQGRHAEALAEFRAAAARDPSFGPARLLAGTSLLALGRSREAIAELERAVALLPGERAAHQQLAEACEREGRMPCLAREARALAALDPADPEPLYRLGKAYLRLSQWSYERIRAIDPRSARLSEALGREYARQGQLDEAVRAYRQAAERGPTLQGIHLAIAGILADAGRWDEAAREVARELAIAPGSAAARDLKARIEAARAGR